MAYKGFYRVSVPIFEEQAVVAGTTYYSDIVSMDIYDSANFHITSSGTVNGTFELQSRSRPAPEVGTWADQDDGYWYHENVTISGAQGNGVKQKDSVSVTNFNSSQMRIKMDFTVGGTLAIHTTLK